MLKTSVQYVVRPHTACVCNSERSLCRSPLLDTGLEHETLSNLNDATGTYIAQDTTAAAAYCRVSRLGISVETC